MKKGKKIKPCKAPEKIRKLARRMLGQDRGKDRRRPPANRYHGSR